MQVAMTRAKMPGSASRTAVSSLRAPRESSVSSSRISIVQRYIWPGGRAPRVLALLVLATGTRVAARGRGLGRRGCGRRGRRGHRGWCRAELGRRGGDLGGHGRDLQQLPLAEHVRPVDLAAVGPVQDGPRVLLVVDL